MTLHFVVMLALLYGSRHLQTILCINGTDKIPTMKVLIVETTTALKQPLMPPPGFAGTKCYENADTPNAGIDHLN